MQPRFVLLGGPNGSGKSTLVRRIDPEGLDDIINPDTIRLADGSLASVLQAGRMVIQRTASHLAAGRGHGDTGLRCCLCVYGMWS